MAPLEDADLLAAWEAVLGRPAALRGVTLLALAERGMDEGSLAALPLGEAARRLLELQAQWFTPALRCVCECPACGVTIEAHCDALALCAAAARHDAAANEIHVVERGYVVRLRRLSAVDVAHAAGAVDAAAARARLIERCVVEVTHDNEPCSPRELPHDVTVALADAIEHADPLADIGLALQCPTCEAAWSATLDPAQFLLAGVDAAARNMMHEVHMLARAYGWSEAETLTLGRARRRAYIELAGA